VVTNFSSFTRPSQFSSRCRVGGSSTVIACLALTAALTSAAKADPVTGTVTLTVAPTVVAGGGGINQGPVTCTARRKITPPQPVLRSSPIPPPSPLL
jgi:hypothetical protein